MAEETVNLKRTGDDTICKQGRRGWGNRITAALLALAMALGIVLLVPAVALADDVAGNSKTVVCLGTSGIEVPAAGWSNGSGSYVYYGRDDEGNPARFRVLANGTTAYTGGTDKTMLLDCDMALFTGTQWDSSASSNKWHGSGAYVKVNEFLRDNLTAQERAAVRASSTEDGVDSTASSPTRADFRLYNDMAFVLSVTEARTYYADNNARVKPETNGLSGSWWLRSAGDSNDKVAVVNASGSVSTTGVSSDLPGYSISPAFNVGLSSVIFSTETADNPQEHKLTLVDTSLGASGSATISGTTATITYSTEGNDVTQASYVITDAQWTDSGWSWNGNAPTVYAYGSLGDAGSGRTGTFTLPNGCVAEGWGTAYHVYVLAEVVNGAMTTDYACAPVEVRSPVIATHAIFVTANPADGGTAKADKSEAIERATVQLTATPAEGFEFERWTLDGEGASVDEPTSPTATLTVGTSDVTATANFRKKDEPVVVPDASVAAHVQRIGWMAEITDGGAAGTTGRSRRLEALTLRLPDGVSGGIEYRGHLQRSGWEKTWKADGEQSGTTGKSRRMEAVQVRLTGEAADAYDVYYRVHVQRYGWMAWAKNGEEAGTQGMSRRAEAIQVALVRKGEPAPSSTYKGVSQTYAKAFAKK